MPHSALLALIIGAATLLDAPVLFAQGTKADYERAFGLRERFKNQVRRDRVEPHWVAPTRFWYANDLGDHRREYVLVDAEAGDRSLAFDHGALAEALSAATDTPHDAERLDLERLQPSDQGLLLKTTSGWWRWHADAVSRVDEPPQFEELKPLKRVADRPHEGPSSGDTKSPDGRWRVVKALGALVLIDTTDGSRRELAPAPDADGHFEPRAHWSPDSRHVVVWETTPGDERRVHLIESSPQDRLQPKLHDQTYPKPGDRLRVSIPRLFQAELAEEVAIDGALLANPWSIDRLRWRPDSAGFTFLFNQRGHQTVRLVEVRAEDGATRALIEETFPTFVHYSGRGKCWLRRLDATNEVLWTSERDGWNHLYLLDAADGRVKQQVTRGPWVVRGVDHVDIESRQIWFRASGVRAEQDPYYVHHCRVDFDGSNLTVLTSGDGDHTAQWSPDGRYLIDTYSRVDLPPITELRHAQDGSLVCRLEEADISGLVEAGWRAPERFVAKGRDGKTDIYGIVCRPTNFDPERKYPVIEEHYAGPHSSHCPKRFAPLHRSQEMADLGFLVVQLDGMGTDHRGKAFHDVCWQNLVDGGFPDRIAWLRAAAAHEPAIDLTRVGIRGTSAGGQTGMAALLHHGDFYRACVSNCGCHDNRTDKVWWNEQWMGWPIGPHYHEQSNVTNAHKLTGDLLLIVGEMDRNVPPTATLQVVDALIRADKDFGFLFVPGGGHGARHPANGDYTNRQTWDFFVRKLHGVTPRSE